MTFQTVHILSDIMDSRLIDPNLLSELTIGLEYLEIGYEIRNSVVNVEHKKLANGIIPGFKFTVESLYNDLIKVILAQRPMPNIGTVSDAYIVLLKEIENNNMLPAFNKILANKTKVLKSYISENNLGK